MVIQRKTRLMAKTRTRPHFSRARYFGLSVAAVAGLAGCDASSSLLDEGIPQEETISSTEQAITDVAHTPVERQSIGNCWLYSQATWVESMALSADPTTELDISQSYWTYWHWFDQVTGFRVPDEIQTGGFQFRSHAIVRDRGLMPEAAFVPDDLQNEMSSRQKTALNKINAALEAGEFEGADGKKVREIFDDAWDLSPEVRAQLDQAFLEDGEGSLRQGADLTGTDIIDPADLQVRYTELVNGQTEVRDTNLVEAIASWEEVRFPFNEARRRTFLQRVQRALHDRQPVVITWDVDFNALENDQGELQGSFNLTTLEAAGRPGRQGGHMTVLEDYAAETEQFGLLEAGVTLDPEDPQDAEKLEAALEGTTKIKFLRIKNSWGANRPDREFAPGFPGYHDLYMDYLTGPIPFCPDQEDATNDNCNGESTPLRNVMLPPGY
jgi:hypothetical protein